ncbi:hypothetical protein DBT_1388 [Dissulfuribacter thermophilus]|uniref:Uncharacterized protein n=1 Tax=Dissulfuribacter thermophilus TaxID=1156395 RepID=A0A1B9F630_9BACT|nr:hypothetical protein DBT_1388 [Dissulfuribacter thermophilus]
MRKNKKRPLASVFTLKGPKLEQGASGGGLIRRRNYPKSLMRSVIILSATLSAFTW